jgi:membrane-associated protein
LDIFSQETLISLIKTIGYLGIFAIVFAESGLLIGFFLPGDSLLFTAGFLASQGFLNIYGLLVVIFVGAVLGDNVGYTFGNRIGRKIFKREDSLIFRKANLLKAEAFYQKHGPITIVLARFIPVVRTFAPILAGAGRMEYRRFMIYNTFGGLLWTLVMTLAGFFLVKIFPDVEQYLFYIIALIIALSVTPPIWQILRARRNSRKTILDESENN